MRQPFLSAVLGCLCPVGVLIVSPAAGAATIPYQNVGVENKTTYSFQANGGDISATYLGTGAAYDERLGLLVNGKAVSPLIFENHQTGVGSTFDFGSFAKGSTITFFIEVQQNQQTFYSDVSKNNDGANHIYSTTLSATGTTPASTYVGFEDLSADRKLTPHQDWDVDYNYTDEQFSFTNLTVTTNSGSPISDAGTSTPGLVSPVPLPASAPMFGAALLGLAGLGYAANRKKVTSAA